MLQMLSRCDLGPRGAAHHPEDAVGALFHLCYVRAGGQHPDRGRKTGRRCGRQHRATGTRDGHEPQVCLVDPRPPKSPTPRRRITSKLGSVILTADPRPASRAAMALLRCPRQQPILPQRPDSATPTASRARETFASTSATTRYPITSSRPTSRPMRQSHYLKQNNINSAPWLSYKLVNVQYYPYDKDSKSQTSPMDRRIRHHRRTPHPIPRPRATIRPISWWRQTVHFSSLLVACRRGERHQHRMESGRTTRTRTPITAAIFTTWEVAWVATEARDKTRRQAGDFT